MSWSKFFKFENLQLKCCYLFGNFLIEEEKKTVEAFDDFNNWYNTYIIDGESGHSRECIFFIKKHNSFNQITFQELGLGEYCRVSQELSGTWVCLGLRV